MPTDNLFPGRPPAEDDIYEIWSMCYGTGATRRVHDNFMMRDMHDGPMPLDYNLWILRNAHRVVLVDTGFGPRASTERGRPIQFDPIEGLKRIGVDPDAIEDIVITHLHYDHAGNIDRFGKARFHVQDGEVAYATGRCMCEAHTRFPYDVEDIVTLVRRTYADRVVFHEGDDDLLPGLTLHAFPGHSAMVQAVRVNTARGPVLLASDSTHYFANILNMKPFVLTIDTSATIDSYHRILKLAGGINRLIPGHDPKVRRLYPVHEVNGIELLALHEEPNSISATELARTDNF
jgi:glyoxylase-like metal-dependent hydrolase (beta-lactamase superfamily II)